MYFQKIFQTTESVYMPLETTASMIDEIEAEIWNSEKEKFDTKKVANILNQIIGHFGHKQV